MINNIYYLNVEFKFFHFLPGLELFEGTGGDCLLLVSALKPNSMYVIIIFFLKKKKLNL